MNDRILVTALVLALSVPASALAAGAGPATPSGARAKEAIVKVTHSEKEWQKLLTSEQFRVLRQHGTEVAFTGKYWNNHAEGTYLCAACGLELFSSATKFDSGTGWPSFWQPFEKSHVIVNTDASYGMSRDEVTCARCGGHLGHVFDDGPKPTGLRYCINSAALKFAEKEKK